MSSHLFLRGHQVLFEVTNVRERDSVFGLAAAVNLPARLVVFMQESQSGVGGSFDAFAFAVASAKGADWIKTFQRETWRINPSVTNGTCFGRLMFCKCLANRRGSASIGLDGTGPRRRRVGRQAQQIRQNKTARV